MLPNHGMKYAPAEGLEGRDNGVAAPLLTLTRFHATMVAKRRIEKASRVVPNRRG